MNTQLTLGVMLRDDATFDNFFVGTNQQALSCLVQLVQGKGERIVYLSGPNGAGVSHLLQACCHAACFEQQSSIYLPLSEPQLTPEVLQDLEGIDLICVDDLESAVENSEWEEQLFHLYNRVRDSGGRLLLGAKAPPSQLHCQLEDLRSRLCWGLALSLETLDDEHKLAALQFRAKKRGLQLSAEVGAFLLRHYSRDTATLFSLLDQLDRASLAAKRRLTVPFVKQVLVTLGS